MEIDTGAPSLLASPIPLLLIAVAAIAFVYGLVSSLKAWRLSYGHPQFDALGFRKWVMGAAVIAYMPPAAIPYIKQYFAGLAVFILAFAGLALYAAFGGNAQP